MIRRRAVCDLLTLMLSPLFITYAMHRLTVVMFWSSFVCLFVNKITRKCMGGFSWNSGRKA